VREIFWKGPYGFISAIQWLGLPSVVVPVTLHEGRGGPIGRAVDGGGATREGNLALNGGVKRSEKRGPGKR